MQNYLEVIRKNNQQHTVDLEELWSLIRTAETIFSRHFPPETYFERSIFINWTCAIADCQYCYLSTVPKYTPPIKVKAVRSKASILAEALICRAMGWKVGYITGGLRVESPEHLIDLATNLEIITGHKIIMNFGPYSHSLVEKFKPSIAGMGAAIESFDEDLHNFICPSKPLSFLLRFLNDVDMAGLQKLITIILGIGERKEDLTIVIQKIKQFNIEKVQLCFLKPQKNTIFDNLSPPDPHYMAWWIANIRIACPTVIITVALVPSRINDLSLYLRAGANSFTRFMVFRDFASQLAEQLEAQCREAGRELHGNFREVPAIDVEKLIVNLPLNHELKNKIAMKARQYYHKLQMLEEKQKILIKA